MKDTKATDLKMNNINNKDKNISDINSSGNKSNNITKEISLNNLLNYNNNPIKFNLNKICENIFKKIQNSYSSDTINNIEIYKTYDYSLIDIKTKSKS